MQIEQHKPSLSLSRVLSGGASTTKLEPWYVNVEALVEAFAPHNVSIGGKNGPYFVRGLCDTRSDKSLQNAQNLLIVIDGDSSINEHGEPVDGAPCPRYVHQAIKQADIEHIIYTTHSHHKKGEHYHKWRLVVPSDASAKTLADGVDAILDILHSQGLLVFPVKENYALSQAWFFPRLDQGRTDSYYTASYTEGERFCVPVLPLNMAKAQTYEPKQNGGSVIDQYCQRTSIRDYIEGLGFKRIRDDRYLPLESTSGIAGARVLNGDDGIDRLYVHNSSSPYYGRAWSVFDLFVKNECLNDSTVAIKKAASILGIEHSPTQSTPNTMFADLSKSFIHNEAKTEPHPIDLTGVDIERPMGLAGEICDYLNATAHRQIPMIYPLVALHLMALVAGDRKGHYGGKLNFFTLAIAPSAAGKEHGQGWFAQIASELKLGRHVVGSIASDVDMIRNLVDGDGRCCYRIDEIQALFNAISNKNANTYENKIGDLLLTLITSKMYLFAGNHRRQFVEYIKRDIEQIEKKQAKANNAPDSDLEAKVDFEELDRERRNLKRKLELIKNGWPDPMVSMMGHSTPEGLDNIVSAKNINSGLIGRCLLLRCADSRAPLNKAQKDLDAKHVAIKQRLERLKLEHRPMIATAEAKQMLESIRAFYDDDDRRNHPSLGAVYARALEQVNKVCNLVALESGKVEPQHVRYAVALVHRSIEDIGYLMRKSEALEHDATIEEIAQHTRELITRNIQPLGTTPSQLKQNVTKSYKRLRTLKDSGEGQMDFYDKVLEHMLNAGEIVLKQDGRKSRVMLG